MNEENKNYLGLSRADAEKLLEQYGPNAIRQTEAISPARIFLRQFTSPLVIILMAAAVVSALVAAYGGERSGFTDAVLILLIVVISSIAGFMQEYKTERAIEALRAMSAPKARVIREGVLSAISAEDVVPGDILWIKSGDIVAADAKLLKGAGLNLDESLLTGESLAVGKKEGEEVFMHSAVYSGEAVAKVLRTGMKTKVGEIAEKLERIESRKTIFEQEIGDFSKKVALGIVVIAAAIFTVALWRFGITKAMLMAISLAVAAIPEGLSAVVVLALAMGAKAILKKRALVRKLNVIESIGAVDIICTDKTGTLTKNEMSPAFIWTPYGELDFGVNTNAQRQLAIPAFAKTALETALLTSDLEKVKEDGGNVQYIGDQTELAFLRGAQKAGISLEKLTEKYSVIEKKPFSVEKKIKSALIQHTDRERTIITAGAPEAILSMSTGYRGDTGERHRFDEKTKKEIASAADRFAGKAMRIIACASRTANNVEGIEEKNMTWLALIVLSDPARPEVKGALQETRSAGIRTIMITGDHAKTAVALAQEIGLESNGVITGAEIEKMTTSELHDALESGVNIYARTMPTHKLRILELLEKDKRVAMTGDGVNDSLALKRASVGIAMGVRGTEVAKEASDIVLLDDNFATIASAVKAGRRIFDNIRKFINYLFVSNLAEVGSILIATLFFPLRDPVLFPIQILWINLLTDGPPAMALGIDPARPGIMREKPRRRDEKLINKGLWWQIALIGIKKTIILLATFIIILKMTGSPVQARTALFTGFVLYEFVRIGSIRAQEKLGWFSNKWLLVSLFVSVLMQMIIVYTPFNSVFHIEPLLVSSWLVLLTGVSVGYVSAIFITRAIMKYVK